jgi:hypothetical protein
MHIGGGIAYSRDFQCLLKMFAYKLFGYGSTSETGMYGQLAREGSSQDIAVFTSEAGTGEDGRIIVTAGHILSAPKGVDFLVEYGLG